MTARRLLGVVRRGDVVVRLGGDEFVMVTEGIDDPAAIRALAGRLVTTTSEPIEAGPVPATVRGSVGVAMADGSCTDPAELIRAADTAMYTAKRGRHGVVFADEL